ncbi:uracil-DNA glycosylase [Sphaerobacter thermophilus]|uniref:Type-4 uracil-DNA glycosylase n=1 Tax=Sphaerobacter thermophilus (strain ATCC 49802 / DSM 20745 / KCCM 41009 / NCIMB 13125 / S 6022) TaxID=479434 RepID=D1C2B2_SPHTD|nr:uracil-DNA glycosylase [Sphaerobacter thermophilus]ACZ38379.1 phage SPO1 DNA polymerase-related protein [Sphaerobacter thermophilus DSM 20745]
MTASLDTIAARVRVCTQCELHRMRTNAVPGNGNPNAEVMFIGEGPGWHEDRQGLPFVGAAGQFLNEMLQSIGLSRDEVFITNIVKCRPPGNRDPLPDEIAACSAYLDAQIAAIKPKVIVTLGRFSMARWFPNERISRIHGQPRRFGDVVVVPMYHPAAALHQSSLRATIEADMAKLPQILEEARREAAAEDAPPPPQQMRLF